MFKRQGTAPLARTRRYDCPLVTGQQLAAARREAPAQGPIGNSVRFDSSAVHEIERRRATIENAADQVDPPLQHQEVQMRRLLDAVCELIEAHAARIRTETFENEMEQADWASASPMLDDD